MNKAEQNKNRINWKEISDEEPTWVSKSHCSDHQHKNCLSQKTLPMTTTTNTTSQLQSSSIQSPSSSQFQSQNDVIVKEIDVFICHAGKESKEGIGKSLYDELTKQSSLLKIILVRKKQLLSHYFMI